MKFLGLVFFVAGTDSSTPGGAGQSGKPVSRAGFVAAMRFLIALIFSAGCVSADSLPVYAPKLVGSTYVGTGKNSRLGGFTVDSDGFIYIGGFGPRPDGSGGGFLMKLDPTGSKALWTTYPAVMSVTGVALDQSGNIYITGMPTLRSSAITKLAPDGQTVIYSTEIAGAGTTRLAVDSSGAAYVIGNAGNDFVPTPGAFSDFRVAFAAKLDPAGTVVYATFLDVFIVTDIAANSHGEAWITGYACPGSGGLNCDDSTVGTASVVEKLNASGTSILISKNFGGGGFRDQNNPIFDIAEAVAVDSTDSVWMLGSAASAGVPITPNAIVPQRPNFVPKVGYVVKYSPAGDLLYGSYIAGNSYFAGNQQDLVRAIAIDAQDDVYFGQDTSPSASVVMALSPDGSTVLMSQVFGSTVQAIALDGNGGLYTGSSTNLVVSSGPGFPTAAAATCPTTPGAYQPFGLANGNNICVGKFDLTQNAPAVVFNPVNSASLHGVIVAPGEIVTMFGQNLPPEPMVTFDGFPAPVLYSDAGQINAVVPFEVNAPLSVMQVEGVAALNEEVAPAAPAIFTLSGTGAGQAVAFNEDGTINSANNPAAVGSTIRVYMTGAGAMMPPIDDGELGPLQPPYPTPVLNVTATIGGNDAPVIFVRQAPGLIAGAIEVNMRVPGGSSSVPGQVIVQVGDRASQISVFVAVQ